MLMLVVFFERIKIVEFVSVSFVLDGNVGL